MQFVPMNFISNMRYMGLGMLGIFVVIGIIAGVTCILGAVAKRKDKNAE